MRHGMTIAEIARLFNEHFGIGAELDVAHVVAAAVHAEADAVMGVVVEVGARADDEIDQAPLHPLPDHFWFRLALDK